LWQELTDGKHRGPKPFRVIVSGVVKFACQGWEGTTLGRDAPLEEWTVPATEEFIDEMADEVVARLDVGEFVESLPPGDSEVARMKMLEYLDVDQIAEATGRTSNAVHQALHRIRREWKTWLEN
jgi:DNA-directed RNA polymerase specialized sigma24 family protein